MTITDKMAVFNSISNPEYKPLEELNIKTYVNGVLKDIPALDEYWVSQGKIFVQYFPPLLNDQNRPYPLGAKEDWLERMSYLHADMKWLLSLNHHRFWSQVVIGDDSLIGVESFLQEATPFYVTKSFPNDSKMIGEYKVAQHLVFLVLVRLSTQKESETEWIGSKKLGKLWYDKYLITLPMLLDMSLLYGHSNANELSKMFKRIFKIQPLYNEDVKNALVFIDERLRMVQEKFSSKRSNESNLPLKLIDQNTTLQSAKRSEFTLISLSDMILYVLDTAVNLTSFLSVHQPACALFHSFHFETRIVSLYENTIPKMYKELDFLLKKEDTIDVYFDIKFKLDLARHELIKLFRYSSYSTISVLFESPGSLSEDEIKSSVENFISVLSEFLSEKVFIQDYNNVYPVDLDLQMLSQICPELDSIKCDFLIESVLSCYDLPKLKSKQESSSSSSGRRMANDYLGPSNLTNGMISKKVVKGIQLKSLISEVKDIMPHLGEGFVQKCLEYYDYNSASVINAILENSLPEPLECLDMEMAANYDDIEKSVEENGLPERANVFDNDEFDVMTQDYVDTSKIHKGKWKLGHKNFNEMLNDKSHIGQLKESYARLGIVVDEVDVLYDDEYDDTYDGVDVSVKEPDEPERRPFVTPRVLQTSSSAQDNSPDYEESEQEDDEEEAKNRDNFVENPEVVRARLAHQRQLKQFNRGSKPPPSRDVVGKPKGQGQDNIVFRNRDYKHSHKSTFANHNRRSGAQRKRNQGMMPS